MPILTSESINGIDDQQGQSPGLTVVTTFVYRNSISVERGPPRAGTCFVKVKKTWTLRPPPLDYQSSVITMALSPPFSVGNLNVKNCEGVCGE